MRATLWTDGGSRGNPGLAGAGIVLECPDETRTAALFLGTHLTNNEAEYRAFFLGLQLAHACGVTHLECRLDSKLVVNQINGDWKVKSDELRVWHGKCIDLSDLFRSLLVTHIRRELNTQADALANQAMDQVRPR